jgi:hypothetical protein
MATWTWTAMTLAVVLAVACDETDQRDGTSPLDAGHMLEDARATPPDAEQASEDARVTEEPRQQPTLGYRFIIENKSADPVYIQAVGGAGAAASVSLVEDGSPVQWRDTCELCNCGPCASCAVCGRSLAAVERIEPGASHTLNWDGNIWEQARFSCDSLRSCERSLGAPRGNVTVSVRYAADFKVVNEGGAGDRVLQGTIRTAMGSFRYVDGAEARIELR